MDIAASLIKLIFGSKADKDRKQIEPYLDEKPFTSKRPKPSPLP